MSEATPTAQFRVDQVSVTAAVVREDHGRFEFQEFRIGDIRDDEVLVQVVASGLCHTDIAVRERHIPTPLPVVLGHEGAGIVLATGSAVKNVAPGDHVVMSYLSCGECRECISGSPASCVQFFELCFGGARPDGSHALCGHNGAPVSDRFFGQSSFATHAVANSRNIIKVATDLPLELLAPLGCGIMTGAGAIWNELPVTPGSAVAIFGAGAVGLGAVMAAQVAGAATIIVIDRVQARLDLARELGATHAVLGGHSPLSEEIRVIAPSGVDAGFDTTGVAAVIAEGVRALRQRGEFGMVASTPTGDLTIDLTDAIVGCKSIRGIIEGGGSAELLIPRMIELHRAGRFPFDKLVRYYDFEDINEAVRDSVEGRVVKPILRMPA